MPLELFPGEAGIAKDLAHQAGTDVLARVDRYYGPPTIRVPQDVMTALDAKHLETRPLESSDQILACDRRKLGHTETR